MKMFIEENTFDSSLEDAFIFYKIIQSKKVLPKKIHLILFQHGAVESHQRHQELFDSLLNHLDKNTVIAAMDFVGHGVSGGERVYIESFNNYVKDLKNFISLLSEKYKDHTIEFSLIGHSMGGLAIIRTLVDFEHEIALKPRRVILSNPCIKPVVSFVDGVRNFFEKVSPVLGHTRIPSLYSGKDLTHDREKAIDFDLNQLYSNFVTLKFGIELLKSCDTTLPYAYFFNYPTLFLKSGKDKIVDIKAVELFEVSMDERLTKAVNYPEAYHDLLNETCRTEVFQEIIDFIRGDSL